MNLLDLIAILLVVVAAIFGFRSGALPQIGGLIGALIGGAGAVLSLPWFADWLRDVDPSVRPFLVLGGLLLAVGIGESIGSAAGRSLARALGDRWQDRAQHLDRRR